MAAYLIRRLLLTIPTIMGIVLITFLLFNVIGGDPARPFAGKNPTPESLHAILAKMGLDKPRFINTTEPLNTQFFDLVRFKFPHSMRYDASFWELLAERGPVSLTIALPAFFISLGLQLGLSLISAARLGRWPDYAITAVCILLLALPPVSLYYCMQWVGGAWLGWFPVAGWEDFPYSLKYVCLPVICAVLASLGAGTRFYRTVVLDEVGQDYLRTARAKGVSETDVYLVHLLRNALVPVVTTTVTQLPLLVLGELILESVFQIPGLGGLLVGAILNNDYGVVMPVTYLSSISYCLSLLATDILYTLVDPRIALK